MDSNSAGSGRFSKNLYALTAMFFFVFLGAGAQQAYLVPYLTRVTGWSSLQGSTVIALVYASMMVFRVLNIYLFRRWSDRAFTIVGACTYLFFTLAMCAVAYVPSYALALASAAAWGVGAAMMWTGTTMQTLAIADAAGGRHGAGMGILYASSHAGWLVGVIALGQLYKSLPTGQLQYVYLAAAAFTLPGILYAFRLPATDTVARDLPPLSGLWQAFTQVQLLIPGFLQFTAALSFGLILGGFGEYIERAYGARWIWVAVGLYPATRMVLSFVGGYLTDRLGQTAVLAGGFLAGAAGLALAVCWNNPLSAVCAGFALGVLSGMVPVAASAIVGGSADAGRRPMVYGLIFGLRDLGVTASAIGVNLIGLRYSLDTAFIVFVGLFTLCALLSLSLQRLTGRRM